MALAQLKSAVKAVEGGTPVVIANGTDGRETILEIVRGKPVGTLVTTNGHSEVIVSAEQLANEGQPAHLSLSSHCIHVHSAARRGSQALQELSSIQRASILTTLATLLTERETEILAANARDLSAAKDLPGPLRSRLSLNPDKLAALGDGMRQLSGQLFCPLSL